MRRVLVVLALIVGLPMVMLTLGAVPLPVRGQAVAADAGADTHTIYVISNGFHSAIALPADVMTPAHGGDGVPVPLIEAFGIDETDFPVDRTAVRYWQIGWGSQTAYTSLRAVRDLTLGISARALAFDATVVHVQPLGMLRPGRGVVPVAVSQTQLDGLVAAMVPSLASTQPIAGVTQGFGDRFYPGRGRFSPIATCNSWTGWRLRQAGIGVGLWTPIAQTLGFGLARVQAR